MKLISGNLVKTVIQFAKEHFDHDLDEKEVSKIVRGLSFSDNMNLAGALKDDDVNSFSDFFSLTDVEEAITPYGAQNAQQRSMNTKQQNANRRANNAQQDANRDATAKGREIAGNNKQRTGVPSPPPPTDVRGMNTNNINSNSAEIGRNREELERLKQLAFGRR
jgi:FtsZ-interacting cell division protein YlmF